MYLFAEFGDHLILMTEKLANKIKDNIKIIAFGYYFLYEKREMILQIIYNGIPLGDLGGISLSAQPALQSCFGEK